MRLEAATILLLAATVLAGCLAAVQEGATAPDAAATDAETAPLPGTLASARGCVEGGGADLICDEV